MTTGMTTPTLHTAAAAGGGVRVFGLPWWFPLALLPLLAVVPAGGGEAAAAPVCGGLR